MTISIGAGQDIWTIVFILKSSCEIVVLNAYSMNKINVYSEEVDKEVFTVLK